MKCIPKYIILSLSIEKEKQDLQKQIDNFNMLISKDMTLIKNAQKKLYKNRKLVKQMIYKVDEYIEKDPSSPTNNSSSSSIFLLLNLGELIQNLSEKFMGYFITEKISKDR
jgi:hypothetical protein